MKFLFGRHVFVQSVGLRRGTLDGFMVSVMDEIGVDVSGHTVRTFDDLEDGSFDLIVSLSPEAQHHAVEMTRTMATEIEFWNTFDPSLIEGNRFDNQSLSQAFKLDHAIVFRPDGAEVAHAIL